MTDKPGFVLTRDEALAVKWAIELWMREEDEGRYFAGAKPGDGGLDIYATCRQVEDKLVEWFDAE